MILLFFVFCSLFFPHGGMAGNIEATQQNIHRNFSDLFEEVYSGRHPIYSGSKLSAIQWAADPSVYTVYASLVREGKACHYSGEFKIIKIELCDATGGEVLGDQKNDTYKNCGVLTIEANLKTADPKRCSFDKRTDLYWYTDKNGKIRMDDRG